MISYIFYIITLILEIFLVKEIKLYYILCVLKLLFFTVLYVIADILNFPSFEYIFILSTTLIAYVCKKIFYNKKESL